MAEKLRKVLDGAVLELLITHEPEIRQTDIEYSESDSEESSTSSITPGKSTDHSVRVLSVVTKGKRAAIVLDDNTSILITFALSGKLEYSEDEATIVGGVGSMKFATPGGGTIIVTLRDPQRLASLQLGPTKAILESGLPAGFDPLHTIMGMREWINLCRSHANQRLVTFLINQNIIAGIGNRYRSEILYVSQIPPDSKLKDLRINQIQILLVTIYRILKLASRSQYSYQIYRKKTSPSGARVSKVEITKGVWVWTTAG